MGEPILLKVIQLKLTVRQIEKFEEMLSSYVDLGPDGEGWRSEELEELIELLYVNIEESNDKQLRRK